LEEHSGETKKEEIFKLTVAGKSADAAGSKGKRRRNGQQQQKELFGQSNHPNRRLDTSENHRGARNSRLHGSHGPRSTGTAIQNILEINQPLTQE
jgi:hypothetical protein